LAREAARDDINGNSIGSKSLTRQFPHVFIARHVRPVLRQYLAAEWVNLAEGHGLKATRALEAQAEPADPRKKVQHPKHSNSARVFCGSCWGVRKQVASGALSAGAFFDASAAHRCVISGATGRSSSSCSSSTTTHLAPQ
jgi:hypothetical protein